MILIEIQENIIKSKNSLEYLEGDFLYKLSKTISGKAEFESSLRNILNASIDLRNKIIVQVQSIIRKSENKELIALIDSGYFRKISEAMSTESLVRIVHVGAISIPETSARVVAENRDIDVVMHNITIEINIYNASISKLKQESNRLFLRLYSIPSASQLPKEIEGAVSLGTLLSSSDYSISSGFTGKLKDTPTETPRKEEPKKETEGKLKIKMKHKP
jgi:hypothetical protein